MFRARLGVCDTISTMRVTGIAFLLLSMATLLPAAKNLEVYFVDVEGGQATLVVAPSGQSLLVDAGWPGYNGRDADRIAAAAKRAGVKRIDYMLMTHYHTDHVGGVAPVAARIPIVNYVDHGDNTETGKSADQLAAPYLKLREKGTHLVVKPGDKIPIKGLDVTVVAARGETIASALPGAGGANPLCASFQPKKDDPSENAKSVAVMIGFGKFRMADFGDITWNVEHKLVCPNNLLGGADLYLTTHHAANLSNPPVLVHGLRPRVAIMNNGARKGGSPDTIQLIRESPGMEDLWQLHYAIQAGQQGNSPDALIANVDENCQGNWIRLSVERNGAFTVYNSRNKHTKAYQPRN